VTDHYKTTEPDVTTQCFILHCQLVFCTLMNSDRSL